LDSSHSENKLAAIAAKTQAPADPKASFSEWDESKHPRHAAGDDRGGEFAPSAEGAGPWEDKAVADSEWNKGRGWVARGLANVLPENDLPIALAEKIAAGEANANDILGIIDQENLGSFWYGLNNTADGGSMSDVESFAYTEDSFGSKFAEASLADAKATGENAIIPTSVVLIAKRPKGWSPDENPDNGLMGNSYIDRKSVRLEAVRYKSAKGWVTKRVNKTVNLSSAEKRKQFSIDRALQRVDFAVIAQRALGIEEDIADKLANLAAKVVSQQLTDERLTALLGPDVDTIGQVRIDDAGIGKIKAGFKDGLSRAWALGLNQAMTETAKARKATFSKSDRQAHFAALRENAADWFESNAFRMAGNFTDGMKAIIRQELLQAVKTGLRPEPAAARIFTRLIERGFMTLDAVRANETREQVLELVTEALKEAAGSENVAAYLNTLVRTNTFEALNEARYAEFSDPAVSDFVVALQYSAILDDRTTPICRELDGHIHAVGSKVWQNYRPPNHYNCRSVVFAVTTLDGWDGTESPDPVLQPQEGFK
jgi:SPP1 gp7 family putative phage head morphogenesis protein